MTLRFPANFNSKFEIHLFVSAIKNINKFKCHLLAVWVLFTKFGINKAVVFEHSIKLQLKCKSLTVKFRGVTLGVKLIFVFSVTFGMKGL